MCFVNIGGFGVCVLIKSVGVVVGWVVDVCFDNESYEVLVLMNFDMFYLFLCGVIVKIFILGILGE